MKTDNGRTVSYWMASAEETSYPPLAGDLEVDVAVVGGGIAGLCTAWELARAWPDAELVIVEDSGHTGSDTTRAHVVAALDRFAGRR